MTYKNEGTEGFESLVYLISLDKPYLFMFSKIKSYGLKILNKW